MEVLILQKKFQLSETKSLVIVDRGHQVLLQLVLGRVLGE